MQTQVNLMYVLRITRIGGADMVPSVIVPKLTVTILLVLVLVLVF